MAEEPFLTQDLYVATAAKTAGEEFLGIMKSVGGRGVFRFKNSVKLQRVVKEFYEGTLTQNVRAYVDNWLALKKMVSRNGD